MKHTRKTNGRYDTAAPIEAHTPRYRVSGESVRRRATPDRRYDAKRRRPARTVTRRYEQESGELGFSHGLIARFNAWRLGISIDADTIVKGFVVLFLGILFILLQTTLFTRFRPFGAIPDMMLPFVIAISVKERERGGAVTALCAAFVIDALGGSAVTLLPLLYVSVAYAAGILTTHRFREGMPSAALYTAVSCILKCPFTLITALLTIDSLSVKEALIDIVLPEAASSIITAIIPLGITFICLRPFHKSRAERTGGTDLSEKNGRKDFFL